MTNDSEAQLRLSMSKDWKEARWIDREEDADVAVDGKGTKKTIVATETMIEMKKLRQDDSWLAC